MATETTPEQATDEELIARAPAHDGVATQRDLRETERFLRSEIRASERRLDSKIDRLTWIIIVGLGGVIAALVAIAVQL